MSQPYIRAHILQDVFGARWKEVASKFLNEYQEMCYEVSAASVSSSTACTCLSAGRISVAVLSGHS
jgi:hypothetical protein